jgi:hypothetical protein
MTAESPRQLPGKGSFAPTGLVRATGWLIAFAFAWFVLLTLAARLTPYPLVLWDEVAYLLPTLFGYAPENFKQWHILPHFPIPVFYGLYSLVVGTAPYLAAKTLNSALIAATALPTFLVARRFLPPARAAVFAGFVTAVPFCAYVRLFMPESLYVFGFWCTICVLLAVLPRSTIAAAIAAGIALGVLSLVKPHALALALGSGLFLALRRGPLSERTIAVIGTGVAFFLARVGVGYALSGTIDLSLTGRAYADTLVGGRPELATIASYTAGHAASVLLLVGMPLAAIVVALLRGVRSSASRGNALDDLLLLASCLLVALLGMTVYFSCSIHLLDPVSEPNTRLHGRYYVFALPLVMLAYAALAQSERIVNAKTLFDTVGLVAWGGITLGASVLIAVRYPAGPIDYPDLAVLRLGQTGPLAVVVALGAMLAIGLWRRNTGKQGRTWLRLLPLAWWVGVASVTTSVILVAPLVGKMAPTAVDRAMESDLMQALRGRDDGLVIGSSTTAVDTYRVMFHLASRSGGRLVYPGIPVDQQALVGEVRWLILMPGVSYSGPGTKTRVEPLTHVALP